MTAPTTCTAPGCDRPHHARGHCQRHYMQWRHRDRPDLAGEREAARQALLEDIEFMLATGESPAMVATRLHTTTVALEGRLRRLGLRDLAARFDREQTVERAWAS